MFLPIPVLYRLCLLIVSMGGMLSKGFRQVAALWIAFLSFILDTLVWDNSDMGCGLPGFLYRVAFPPLRELCIFYFFL